MLKYTSALASLAVMAMTANAMAEDTYMKSNISTLPKSGAVMLKGTVDSVDGDKAFTLRDMSGKTIDVEAKQKLSVRKGDTVSVRGVVDTGMLGLTKEIEAVSVDVTKELVNEANAKRGNVSDKAGNAMNRAGNAVTGAAASAGNAISDGAKSVGQSVSDAGDAVNTRAKNMMDSSKEWHGGEYGSIDKLPETGKVMLQGKVTSVSDDKMRFVLEDHTGETIDVHTQAAVNVRVGDTVKVNGMMDDEIAGMGEEIKAYKVSRINK